MISVLIVGLGKIGLGYDLASDPTAHVLTHARAVEQQAEFELVGAVDPSPTRRELFEQVYGRPAHESISAALEAHRPEFVIVAAPTQQHAALVINVLECGAVSTILCEKPLAYGLADARAIVSACAARNVALYVNYMRRSDPAVIEVKRRIADGRIRAPIKGVVWYSKGLLHNGSHFFNLLQYWLGPVDAGRVIAPGREWEARDPEPDLQVSFQRGDVVFLAAREEDYSHYTVELIASNGRLRYDAGGEQVEWQPVIADPIIQGAVTLDPIAEMIPSGMRRSQRHVMREFSRMLAGQDGALCTGTEALQTLEALHALLEGR